MRAQDGMNWDGPGGKRRLTEDGRSVSMGFGCFPAPKKHSRLRYRCLLAGLRCDRGTGESGIGFLTL
jgi:hypothetical protein